MHGSALRLCIFILKLLMLMLIILHIMNLVEQRDLSGDSPLERAAHDPSVRTVIARSRVCSAVRAGSALFMLLEMGGMMDIDMKGVDLPGTPHVFDYYHTMRGLLLLPAPHLASFARIRLIRSLRLIRLFRLIRLLNQGSFA